MLKRPRHFLTLSKAGSSDSYKMTVGVFEETELAIATRAKMLERCNLGRGRSCRHVKQLGNLVAGSKSGVITWENVIRCP